MRNILVCTIILCVMVSHPVKTNNNTTPSKTFKAVYNSLSRRSVSSNKANKTKALKKENTKPKRHVPKTTKTVKPAPDNSNFKSYMDARYITSKGTPQYELKSKYKLDDSGVYKVDDRYCVAVGSYYTTKVGTKLDIRLDTGETLRCILADCKADAHTDSTNRQNPNGSVVEFVVHTPCLYRKARTMGDCSYIEGFSGNVTEIVIIEEESKDEESIKVN